LLAELREIGWRDWDPLQLRNVMLEGQFSCADEYDSYLLTSAGMAANGRSPEDIARYLSKVETERMGCRSMGAAEDRAEALARVAVSISRLVDDEPRH
jgi:hypothetical protein